MKPQKDVFSRLKLTVFIISFSFVLIPFVQLHAQDFGSIAVHGSFQQFTEKSVNGPFLVHDGDVLGGRFYIDPNGNTAIGLRPTDKTWPSPIAKFQVVGQSVLGGNVLISNDLTVQKNWANNSQIKNSTVWGLWLDKGVVATDYAITTPTNWADFVFEKNYTLKPLSEVESFINLNKHLPGIPSAREIEEKGYTLHDMNTKLMQKIEELTLYSIGQDKQVKQQQEQLAAQQEMIIKMQKELDELKNKLSTSN